MFDLSSFSKSFVKSTNGSIEGNPRIYNIDQDKKIYGYVGINHRSALSLSRIKMNKGWFTCDPEEIQYGDLIEDRVDNSKYLVMSVKNEVNGGVSVYLEGILYYCNCIATISRFGGDNRDFFGRPIQSSAVDIFTNISLTVHSKTSESIQQPDTFVEKDKVLVYIQAKYDVKEADRITTDQGNVYKIEGIDKNSFKNIWICRVSKDNR